MVSIKELLNDIDEWHALVLGLADGFFFWRSTHYIRKHRRLINKERWYSRAGMVFGFMWFWTFVALVIITVAVILKGVFCG